RAHGLGMDAVVARRARVCERAPNQLLEPVADPDARERLAGRLEACGFERPVDAVRDVGCGVDERAVQVDGEQLECVLAQYALMSTICFRTRGRRFPPAR